MTVTILVLAALILVSGFFSGSEIALFSVPESRAQAFHEQGRRGSRALLALKADQERILITILIGNNLANIGAASIATFAATAALGSAGVGVATGVMTLAVLFFGEIVPKSFAASNADRIALWTAPLLQGLSRLLLPLVIPLQRLTRAVVPDTATSEPAVTETEIRALARMGLREGSIEQHERELIERVFALDTTRAWEVMTPRVDIFAWPAGLRLADIVEDLRTVPYSRIPVYGESLDEIRGVLYTRDAYQALISGLRDVTLGSLAREPMWVPSTVRLVRLLRDFQSKRVHLGVVVDEHGGTDGLITLEDILEELVGEIDDETDIPQEHIVRRGRNAAIVSGNIDLREINHYFNTTLPQLEHRSLNGYLLEEFGRVPDPGESIMRENVLIEVVASSETQVIRALVRRDTSGDPEATAKQP